MSKQTILTGLRANNQLHIGNYFGGLLPIIDMAKNRSDEFVINLFVPDLHSFTTPVDHSSLQQQITDNIKLYVAAGLPLDKPDVHIYRQSRIPAHSELTWILDCFTGMGEMSRMTQFKDKASGLEDSRTSVGLFNYPVLMAADILLYNTVYVPVGEDQTQHLEFTRDIAQRLNSNFGELFTVPKPAAEQHKFFGKDQGLRIMDLADPSKKMSKSAETSKGIIFLNDSPDEARKKVMSATTDDLGSVNYNPAEQSGISNLIEILSLLKGENVQAVATHYKGVSSYGDFKSEVADEVARFLQDIQAKLNVVDENAVNEHIEKSEQNVVQTANQTLNKVQKAVGLR